VTLTGTVLCDRNSNSSSSSSTRVLAVCSNSLWSI